VSKCTIFGNTPKLKNFNQRCGAVASCGGCYGEANSEFEVTFEGVK